MLDCVIYSVLGNLILQDVECSAVFGLLTGMVDDRIIDQQ